MMTIIVCQKESAALWITVACDAIGESGVIVASPQGFGSDESSIALLEGMPSAIHIPLTLRQA